MQVKTLAGFFLLFTSVLAGGYAGAIERVWLYYAYQIDGLNAEADQTIGYKCLKWDDPNKKCLQKGNKDLWVACKGSTRPDKRCTMTELLNRVGRVSGGDQLVANSDGKPLPLETTDPDPQKTAQNLYKHFWDTSLWGDKAGVRDWQPYRILKDDIRAKAAGKPLDNATEKLFSRFEECNRLIKTARIGDHGPYLIDASEKYLNPRGIDVKIEILDPPVNPVDSTKNWKTVDWEETVEEAVKTGNGTKEQLEKMMEDTKKDFYEAPVDGSEQTDAEEKERKKAREHREVIDAFTNAHNKAAGCLPK
ncbi:hypothetical protein GGI43DRAFT_380860 [Trichoderma evansii]